MSWSFVSTPRSLDATMVESHNWMKIKCCALGAYDLDTEINFSYRLIQMMHLPI